MFNVSEPHQKETYNNNKSKHKHKTHLPSEVCFCMMVRILQAYIAFHPASIMINYRLMSFIFYTVELKSLIKLKPKISLRWSRSLSEFWTFNALQVHGVPIPKHEIRHTHTLYKLNTPHIHFVARSPRIKEKMNWLLRAFTKRKLSK